MFRVTDNIRYTPKLFATSVQILSRRTTVPKFKSHATHRYEWSVQTNVYLFHDRPRATRNFTRRITDLVVVLFLKRGTLRRSHRNKMESSFFTFVRPDKSISNKLYPFLLLLLLSDVFSLFQQDKTETGKIIKKIADRNDSRDPVIQVQDTCSISIVTVILGARDPRFFGRRATSSFKRGHAPTVRRVDN